MAYKSEKVEKAEVKDANRAKELALRAGFKNVKSVVPPAPILKTT